jgi:hypothetical protein
VIDNHERFESLTSGIQNIVTAIGIAAGGWWAYHTFGVVGTVQKAELEIATLKQSAARQPILQLDVQTKADAKSTAQQSAKILEVTVKLKNEGNTSLLFTAPVLEIAAYPRLGSQSNPAAFRVTLKAQHVVEDGKYEDMPERLLRAGQARTVAFLIDVPVGRQYLLQIKSSYSAGEFRDGKPIHGEIQDAMLVETENSSIEAMEQVVVTVQ